jgi:hypothetical protein
MDDVFIVESTEDLENSVDSIDVAEECVPEPLALRRPWDKTSDINNIQLGRDFTSWVPHLHQTVIPLIWNVDLCKIWIDGAEGVILRWNMLRAEKVE